MALDTINELIERFSGEESYDLELMKKLRKYIINMKKSCNYINGLWNSLKSTNYMQSVIISRLRKKLSESVGVHKKIEEQLLIYGKKNKEMIGDSRNIVNYLYEDE